jgi:acetyl esterase/lipase
MIGIVVVHPWAEAKLAQEDSMSEAQQRAQEILKSRIVIPVPDRKNTVTRRNMTYRSVDGNDLKMDVYLPEEPGHGSRKPGILFVHGGPLPATFPVLPKDWGIFVSYGELAAASGLVGIAFNHRYRSLRDLEHSVADIKAVIQRVQAQADSLGVDPDRLCLWTFSGGGPQLASFLRDRPEHLRCIVAFYTVLDPRAFSQMEGMKELADLPENEMTTFSPEKELTGKEGNLPPLFIARAGLDHPAINQSIDSFLQKALAANAEVELVNYPEGHHGFDVLDDTVRSREIITLAMNFVKKRLGMRGEE